MKQIKLTKGCFAFVDDENFAKLNKFTWYCHENKGKYYAARHVNTKKSLESKNCLMHRIIMSVPKGMYVDHIDGNGLNNQKTNLRICTHSENMKNQKLPKDNTSGYKGVSWHKIGKKWVAYITVNYKKKNLGSFDKIEDAYSAYCKAAIKYHKEFAKF